MGDVPQYGGDYIVGWKLRLIVRLEEWGDVTRVRDLSKNPITPPQVMRGTSSTRSQATYTLTANGYVVGFAGGTAADAGDPQASDSSPDGLTYCIGGIIPKSFRLELNGFKIPDTMSCELKFVDAPFDPLVFRSVGCELYVGCITQDDYTAGIGGATRANCAQPNGEPLNVVPDSFVDATGRTRSNLRFQGFVDEWEVEFSDENLAIVRLKCSDNTRLLMDQPMPPGLRCDTTLPVDQAIAKLLSQFPQFAGLSVQYKPALPTTPTLGASFAAHAQMPDGLPATQGGAGQSLSVWDYLVELCAAFGHNCRVEGSIIVVQRIRSALGKNFPPRDGDPFQGRTWGGSEHLLRTFIWGRNCKTVRKGRRYARTTVNPEVRSWDPVTKTTRIARFPLFSNDKGIGGTAQNPNASTNRLVHALPGNGKAETKYTVFPVPGVTDQQTLQNIAQAYYEGLNRSELSLTVHTKDLASFGGDASDPDVLDMFAGDRFEYLIERFDGSSINDTTTDLALIENALLQPDAADLFSGFDKDFVAAYLASYTAKGYQTTFVAKKIDIAGSIDDGIDIAIDGANMVEARVDAPGVADVDDAALGSQGTTAPTTQNQPVGGP
jgi:hypothetical protein